MESRTTNGLYVVGELLDIDGITGGFNFQAAWTTGHLAGIAIGKSFRNRLGEHTHFTSCIALSIRKTCAQKTSKT